MRRALNTLRQALEPRVTAANEGLSANGFKLCDDIRDPGAGDVMLVWNRQGGFHEQAQVFERAGGTVIVLENGYLGAKWRGGTWVAVATGHHAGAGQWRDGGPKRWDSWGVELAPWKTEGETLTFAQRSIGEPGIASPLGWAESVQRRIGGRIRPHPGKDKPAVSLEHDLRDVGQVATWHSGAALQALVLGVPVWYGFDRWVGVQAGKPLAEFGTEPKRSDADRLAMFRRMAWATWELQEVRSGEAFHHLLTD